jgi:hypothetical protein
MHGMEAIKPEGFEMTEMQKVKEFLKNKMKRAEITKKENFTLINVVRLFNYYDNKLEQLNIEKENDRETMRALAKEIVKSKQPMNELIQEHHNSMKVNSLNEITWDNIKLRMRCDDLTLEERNNKWEIMKLQMRCDDLALERNILLTSLVIYLIIYLRYMNRKHIEAYILSNFQM